MYYNIWFSCVSHIGKIRSLNQDNFICDNRCMEGDESPAISGMKTSKTPSLFGVFDGIGGEECGEIASLLAARCAKGMDLEIRNVSDLLAFCAKANDEICQYAQENGVVSMGTTAAMLAFTSEAILLCNIGDSKIFRLFDDKLEQISKDHVAIAPYGRKPPLSQNLGILPSEMQIDPYVAQGTYHNGDIYLICSDGLTDMVDKEEITENLKKLPPEEATEKLLNMALEKGGKDNITLILCELEKVSRWKFGQRRRNKREGYKHGK